jgi:hypothetical protein
MAEQWLIDYAALLDAGLDLANRGLHDAAIEKYDVAIALNSHLSAAYINRGLAKFELKRHTEALTDLSHAIDLQPGFAMAHNNRGAIYRALGQSDAAAKDYRAAIELAGDVAIDAHGNLATYYFETKQYELAGAMYEKTIALQPDYALAHWNYGMHLLLLGDYSRGWQEYHWRWQVPGYQADHRCCPAPLWLGKELLRGKTIVLQAEQGFGDMIQFCRYAEQVADLGAHVILEVQPSLVDLCRSIKGVDKVIAQKDDVDDYDFYCPMMSLPLAFATSISTIPSRTPYLTSDPIKVRKWQSILGAKVKPRIGLAWSSDPNHPSSPSRSVPLDALVSIVTNEFEFISLQRLTWPRDLRAIFDSGIRRFEAELGDFSETAALCECLDMVVSVDTSIAHLAGALAKPVCILLHAHNDWRWLQGRSDSPWYPTAKLYRQKDGADWLEVVAELQTDISNHFQGSLQK